MADLEVFLSFITSWAALFFNTFYAYWWAAAFFILSLVEVYLIRQKNIKGD